jgi:hypothetical protein
LVSQRRLFFSSAFGGVEGEGAGAAEHSAGDFAVHRREQIKSPAAEGESAGIALEHEIVDAIGSAGGSDVAQSLIGGVTVRGLRGRISLLHRKGAQPGEQQKDGQQKGHTTIHELLQRDQGILCRRTIIAGRTGIGQRKFSFA